MEKNSTTLLTYLISSLLVLSSPSISHGGISTPSGTQDVSEQWGYVEVRPKCHMFWWIYRSPYRVEDPSKPWPIILWLQGGPGASGVGTGNFQEVGPLDTNLSPRNSTWLRKADLLFVDNPVGSGFSYVENEKDLVTTDSEAATDLTTLLKELFNKNETLQKSPLYIVAESYGGKLAVTLGLSALKATKAYELKLKLGGVALGDSWISPEDYVFSWGPLLKDVSRLGTNAAEESNSMAKKIKQQIKDGQLKDATESWGELEELIIANSNSVDFYNFLLDSTNDPLSLSTTAYSSKEEPLNRWGGQSGLVFAAFEGDFMTPRINEVDMLLAEGVNVTIYNGQLDLICSTKGTEAWINKLKWEGLKKFQNLGRTPLYCQDDKGSNKATKAFTKSYKNLQFYWILGAGHFIPVDQPCVALQMITNITQSPAVSSYGSENHGETSIQEMKKKMHREEFTQLQAYMK
ncbi:hypothetical protein MKX01_040739 [Papaver californicum]|nr:hypothetical protein MKX01_040739 [Papaver californicum]